MAGRGGGQEAQHAAYGDERAGGENGVSSASFRLQQHVDQFVEGNGISRADGRRFTQLLQVNVNSKGNAVVREFEPRFCRGCGVYTGPVTKVVQIMAKHAAIRMPSVNLQMERDLICF